MLRDLRGLLAFAQVVEAKSFSGAARRLGVTKSAVSKVVARLEEELDVQLLVRTTRKLALTEAGERLFATAARLSEDVEAARQAAASHRSAVAGHLRVTAPAVLGRKYLVPVVAEFLREQPRLTVDLHLGDEYVDLVEQRFDVAFRVGRNFTDSSLVARRLADVRMVVSASPRYLAQRGSPKTPADLKAHEWVLHKPNRQPDRTTFRRGKTTVTVKATGRLSCNDGDATVEAAAAGHGIVVAPEYEVSDRIAHGRLVPVLEGWSLDGLAAFAVSPPQRHAPAKVRALVDFVARRWRVPPWVV